MQQYCRRLVYWALPRHPEAVGSYLEGSRLILPMFMVKPLAPAIIRILRRDHKATDDAVRADLSALPAILDRLDQAVADGVIGAAEPNVADLQVACSLALLMTHDDLREYIAARPSGQLAERLAAGYPGRMPAAFPADWLPSRLVGEDRVVGQRVVVEVQLADPDVADLAAGVGHLEARLDGVAAPQVDAPALLRPQVDVVIAAAAAQPLPGPCSTSRRAGCR